MKTAVVICLLMARLTAAPQPANRIPEMLLRDDATRFFNVRLLFVVTSSRQVFLVHSKGVCNLDVDYFDPLLLKSVPIFAEPPPAQQIERLRRNTQPEIAYSKTTVPTLALVFRGR